MKNSNNIILLILFVISFVLFSIPVFLSGGKMLFTDQEVYIRAAENLRTRFSVVYPSPLNEKYQTSIIDSTMNPYVSRHRGLILQYPPGQSIILALLRAFIPVSYNLIECLIGAFGIVFFYLLVNRLLGKQDAVFGTITLLFTPMYYYYSLFATADMTALVVILLSMFFYLKAKDTNNAAFYALCSLCLGVSVWLRYPNVFLIAPFGLHYLITRKKNQNLFPALSGLFVFCGSIIMLLVYHKWAFGGFLTTGYGYNEFKLSEEAKISAVSLTRMLINLPLKEILIKLTNFPIHLAICAPLGLLGLFGLFFLTRNDWPDVSLPLLIALTLFSFYVTVAVGSFGSSHYFRSVTGGYNRYILPVYCLIIIPASLVFKNCSLKKLCGILVVITMINLSSLGFATINLNNLHWELAYQKETHQLQQKHLQLTTEGSIIIGNHVKFYLLNENRHIIDCTERFRPLWEPALHAELTRVVHALLEDGHDVYLVQDCKEVIEIENTVLELIDAETDLYQVTLRKTAF